MIFESHNFIRYTFILVPKPVKNDENHVYPHLKVIVQLFRSVWIWIVICFKEITPGKRYEDPGVDKVAFVDVYEVMNVCDGLFIVIIV